MLIPYTVDAASRDEVSLPAKITKEMKERK
jgi:hypothetical protein